MRKINKEDSSEQCMIKNAAGFPGLSSKEPAYSAGNAGDAGSTPEWGRSPEVGHGDPIQYSCLENPRGARWATGHTVTKSWDLSERLSTHTHTYYVSRAPLSTVYLSIYIYMYIFI